MTEQKIYEIINEVYGYEIINETALENLRSSRDVIVSELGIESIYEFLSYEITEFSEARKSIHVRRFYQVFKDIFALDSFTIESFHKIQAGCLYSALTSGIIRGYGSYDYSGFVNEVLQQVRAGGNGGASMAPADILAEISRQFSQFSRISLGIYGLQIFTKYGICLEKLRLRSLGSARKIFMDLLRKAGDGKDPLPELKKILNIGLPDESKVNDAIDEYIDYATKGVMEDGIPLSRSKSIRKLVESIKEVKSEAKKAFSGLLIDLESLRRYVDSLKEKLPVYEMNRENSDFALLYFSMVEKLILDFDRLNYYEDIYFIKRLNSMFMNRVRGVFDAQMVEELSAIRRKCIKIIEGNLEGYSVYELDGTLNAFSMDNEDFSERFNADEDEVEDTRDELMKYLRKQLEIAYEIRRNLKDNLSGILNPDIMQEDSSGVLEAAITNFTDIREFLLEDE